MTDAFEDTEFEGGSDDDSGLVVRKHGLARVTGLTIRDIDRHCRDGLPIHGERKRGAQLTFHVPTVVQWLLAQARQASTALEDARVRQAEATARRAEVQADKIEGDLVPLETVAAAARDAAAVWRGELLSLPARCPVKAQPIVKAEVEKLVNAIASKVSQLSEAPPS